MRFAFPPYGLGRAGTEGVYVLEIQDGKYVRVK